MKTLKGKFFGLMLTLALALSSFSGQCASAMNNNGPMEMDSYIDTHQELSSLVSGDSVTHHPELIGCVESCHFTIKELSERRVESNQKVTDSDGSVFLKHHWLLELEAFNSRSISFNRVSKGYILPGSFQDRVKLII